MQAIINGKILVGDEWKSDIAILFEENIAAIVPAEQLPGAVSQIINAGGKYVSAGFIDMHVHGCLGADTMDATLAALQQISQGLASTGVTSFLPTTMTMPFPMVAKALENISKLQGNTLGAEILGCHLEGPFINKKYKGAQDEQYILAPDFARIADFSQIIKLITMAPEIDGSQAFIKQCLQHGIRVALGHSDASYEAAQAAFAWGIRHMSHTFNALPPLHHRLPGAIGAAVECPEVACELIADNIHVHPAIQNILLRLKGKEKVILVTDAMRACLLGEGSYDLGGQQVIVQGGTARLENGTIAGSTLRMNEAVKNFMNNTGLTLIEAIKIAAYNPAKALGIDGRKGSIAPGKAADFIIFDEDITIMKTIVQGKTVFGRESLCVL